MPPRKPGLHITRETRRNAHNVVEFLKKDKAVITPAAGPVKA